MCAILNRTMETLQKLTQQFFFHFSMHTYSTSTCYPRFIDAHGRTERKRHWRLSFLSLSLCHNFQYKWLTNTGKLHTSKRGSDKVLWSFVFLRMSLTSFCIQSKFWFPGKAWPLRTASTPAYSVINMTGLPCTLFESHWTSTYSGVHWNSVLLVHHECSMQMT